MTISKARTPGVERRKSPRGVTVVRPKRAKGSRSRRTGDVMGLEALQVQVEAMKMQISTLQQHLKILKKDNERLRLAAKSSKRPK